MEKHRLHLALYLKDIALCEILYLFREYYYRYFLKKFFLDMKDILLSN